MSDVENSGGNESIFFERAINRMLVYSSSKAMMDYDEHASDVIVNSMNSATILSIASVFMTEARGSTKRAAHIKNLMTNGVITRLKIEASRFAQSRGD